MQRFDQVPFAATKTAEGFIRDTPVVGRTGILLYRNADGTERREYRPPDEAFKTDSLASLMGKPITIGHKAFVTAGNAAKVAPVGSVLSAGRQDGNNIVADIVVYNLDSDSRELSCGYTLTLDETPGTTPDGQHYDAIQRNIVYNHLAIVPQGRAGVARLNMDGEQVVDEEEQKEDKKMELTKVRLDTGIEYDCAPEVKVAIEKMNKDSADMKKEADKLQAKYDALEAELKKEKEGRKADADAAKANFDEAIKARVELLKVAEAHKVANADSMTDTEIKTAVIKAVRGDAINLDGKSADYIEAAYDMAKADVKQHEDGMAEQRKATQTHNEDGAQGGTQENNDAADDPDAAYAKLIEAERHMYEKGRE
jgi:hypothetical protein